MNNSLDETSESNPEIRENIARLESILKSIDRPGNFCTGGRLITPLPSLDVDGVGPISFPILDGQAKALMARALRSQFGKGRKSVIDPEIRDSWEIDPEHWTIFGKSWDETLSRILKEVGDGLGHPVGHLKAVPYKLLIYPPGGFFLPHQDAEKIDRMVATLTVTLPSTGTGGKIVVEHMGASVEIDLDSEDRSELTFAAFYSDCRHEVLPLQSGYRVCLVYNLVLEGAAYDEESLLAPNYSKQADLLAMELSHLSRHLKPEDKIVLLLEHAYSESGLRFDTLKNTDAAVAAALVDAARKARFRIYATTVHVEQTGDLVEYDYGYYSSDYEIDEIVEDDRYLAGWALPDGSHDDLGEMSLEPAFLVPDPGNVEDFAEPTSEDVDDFIGNAAPTISREYRLAALVIWPEANTLNIVGNGGFPSVVGYAESEASRLGTGKGSPARDIVLRLPEFWKDPRYSAENLAKSIATGVRLTSELDDVCALSTFLSRVVPSGYSSGGELDRALCDAVSRLGPEPVKAFWPTLVANQIQHDANAVLGIAASLAMVLQRDHPDHCHEVISFMGETAMSQMEKVSYALPSDLTWLEPSGEKTDILTEDVILGVFTSLANPQNNDIADRFTKLILQHETLACPDRTLPGVVHRLEKLPRFSFHETLWKHAADCLLGRSEFSPEPPGDWTTPCEITCDCAHCSELKRFCADPVEHEHHCKAVQAVRSHLEQEISRNKLSIDCATLRRGSPHTLICTKNRKWFDRRLEEYAEDIIELRKLLQAAGSDDIGNQRVQAAIARSS